MLIRHALLAGCVVLSACGGPDSATERAARRMNALHNPSLDTAFAEGKTLVVRYKPLGLQQLSDTEITKLTSAGLCTLDEIDTLFADGAAIRLEIPRGGPYLKVDLKGCADGRPIVSSSLGT